MITFPNAKINIGLNVVEKRQDTFHNLETIFYPIPLCDALEVVENTVTSDTISFSSTGIAIPGNSLDNLCCKAYQMIAKDYLLPKIKIHLHKTIPIGAGLGGGSSDAAFFIKLLNQKFELGISWGEMHHYARQLGSDCSFFVSNKPSFAVGKGDELESIVLDLSNYFICLVYPYIHINTAKAYEGVTPKKPENSLEEDILTTPIEKWKSKIKNDFEENTFKFFPEIEKIKKQLYSNGALYAAMSGSGSSVYGIFDKQSELKSAFPNYFVYESKLT